MAQVQQLFEDSGDAVFGIDQRRRIGYANAAFLQVLGKEESETRGHHCYDVLCADDLANRRFCNSNCPVAREALQRQPMQNFDLVLTRHGEERCWVNVGIYTLPEGTTGFNEPQVYFALRPINGHRLIQRLASELRKPATPMRCATLTQREAEVLALAAHGHDTVGISKGMSISPQTVRNHFKNIFPKLGVRTRSQAVALAIRKQLI